MKKSGLVLVAGLTLLSAVATAAPASKENVQQLIERTGAGNMRAQMVNQMVPLLKKMLPDAPAKFWDEVAVKMEEENMMTLIIPVYQKYFTDADIKGINAFYDTEVGQKLMKAQPQIMQESVQIGQNWGRRIGKEVLELYKKDYKKP